MDTNQRHDEDEGVGAEDAALTAPASSRPDDPAVIAAAAGKTTPERSTENQRPRQLSRQHNRGPPLDDDDEVDDPLAADLLVGAARIKRYLIGRGMPSTTDPYYLKKTGWPIGKTGSGQSAQLIASTRRLDRHADKLARGAAAA